jgi:cell division septum initiation protein DivIVA
MEVADPEYHLILPIVRKYKEIRTETQEILHDIREYRQQFKGRLTQLKKESEDLEREILQFMEKHHHPGIRDQNTTIMKQEKKIKQTLKAKTSEVESILNKYNVDISLHQEVVDILNGKKPRETIPYLKLSN